MTNINELLKEANELVPRISIEDAKALLEDINAVILDVREGQELRETGKIKGAIHVPRGLLEFIFRPEDYIEDEENMKILVYCAAGARAALAAKTLMDIGYKNVFNLGGFKEWVEGGGEIEVV